MKPFAVVISRYYLQIANGLFSGTEKYLKDQNLQIGAVIDAPGAFEIPILAEALASQGKYAGVICLGCVIRGETAHFDFISSAASQGLMTAMLKTRTPIAFGILTTENESQALVRSQGPHNKGVEAAQACHQAAEALIQIHGG